MNKLLTRVVLIESSAYKTLGFIAQCLQPTSWPSIIWGSKKPLKLDPSADHLMPYPWSCRASIMCISWGSQWMFIHTALSRILFINSKAWWFLAASVPVQSPHQESEWSLWKCFERALAPTESSLFWMYLTVNDASKDFREGGRRLMVPTVSLIPRRSRIPCRFKSNKISCILYWISSLVHVVQCL